ncbi:MAG: hypothetical protein GF409_00065 [Candidatus Omnitrophica bacterium]|nr:hypothetical protein [Candidatus Omnitrophota bacterium]
MKKLLKKVILGIMSIRFKLFEKDLKRPARKQSEFLLNILARNSDTEYGRRYGFASIHSVEEFQKRVPVVEYDDIAGQINRMRKGEKGVMASERTEYFGLTSGTTNEPKFIPITPACRRLKKRVTDLWAYRLSQDHPEVLEGKILVVVNTAVKGHTEGGIPYGSESGYAYMNLPGIIKKMHVVPCRVFDIGDYRVRYYCILRFAVEHRDVTMAASPNPNTLFILSQYLQEWKDDIIEDVRKGVISAKLDMPLDIRRHLEKLCHASPGRADELEDVFRARGTLYPKDIWPRICLVSCWKGGSMKVYLDEMEKYFGKVSVRDFGYIATEGRMSLPVDDSRADGILAINSNFYEFIPSSQIDKEQPDILSCERLEKGEQYYVVLTTPGGLYRYQMNDIVEVTGYYHSTPLVEFIQKGSNVSDLSGEKLYESQVEEAMREAARENHLLIHFFTCVASGGSRPHYEFLVEFEEEPGNEAKKQLLFSLEEQLSAQNYLYEKRRKQDLLRPPVLRILSPGDFKKYRSKATNSSNNDTQFKPSKLVRDTSFLDEFQVEEIIEL